MCGFRPLFYAILFFLGLSVALFVIGVLLFLLPGWEVNESITSYNNAVDHWSTLYRGLFASMPITMSGAPTTRNQTFIDFHADFSDINLHDSFNQLHPYSPLKFVSKVASGLLDHQESVPFDPNAMMFLYFYSEPPVAGKNTIRIGYTISNNDTEPIVRDQMLKYSLFIVKYTEIPITSCTSFVIDDDCVVLFQLKSLCLKIKLNERHKMELDDSRGGYGCRPSTDNNLGNWFPGTYEEVLPKYPNFTLNSDLTFNFQGFPLTVRSAHDPLITAAELTGGDLDFSFLFSSGTSSSWSSIRLYVTVGTILIGGTLFLTTSLLTFCLCSNSKTRKWLIVHMREEHQALLQMGKKAAVSSSYFVEDDYDEEDAADVQKGAGAVTMNGDEENVGDFGARNSIAGEDSLTGGRPSIDVNPSTALLASSLSQSQARQMSNNNPHQEIKKKLLKPVQNKKKFADSLGRVGPFQQQQQQQQRKEEPAFYNNNPNRRLLDEGGRVSYDYSDE